VVCVADLGLRPTDQHLVKEAAGSSRFESTPGEPFVRFARREWCVVHRRELSLHILLPGAVFGCA
jgi:hypothetical protein